MANDISQLKGPTPPWMEGSQPTKDDNMLLVHMAEEELEGLDNLQGGPSIDPETDIREYSALEPMIDDPQIRNMFLLIFKDLESGGKKAEAVEKAYGDAKKQFPRYEPTPDEEGGPIEELEETGVNGDTKLAYIPSNLAALLLEIMGGKPDINPNTGLLQFGWLNKIFRNPGSVVNSVFKTVTRRPLKVVGTVLGAMVGGPAGAGVGNYLGGRAHGEKHGRAMQSALPTALSLYGAQGIGQAMGMMGGSPNMLAQGLGHMGIGQSAMPGMATMPGGASTATIAGSPMGNLIQTGPSSYGMAPAGGGMFGGLGSMFGGAQGTAQGGAQGGLGSMLGGGSGVGLGSILSTVGPLAQAGLGYLGSQKATKDARKLRQQEMEDMERWRESRGFNRHLKEAKPVRKIKNPDYVPYDDVEQMEREKKYDVYREPEYIEAPTEYYAKGGSVQSYKQGALVHGKGKGQDDTVRTTVPNKCYIIDAHSTSGFGDGSTKAGSDALDTFERQVKNSIPRHMLKKLERKIGHNIKQVPVFLSEGERKIDPVTVTILGGGSNDKGAAMLKEMVIKLRKHKISKGDGLPPKAKNPMAYI